MLKAMSRIVDVPGVVWVLIRSLFIVAIMLALLVSAGVAYAQGTPTAPTIESVAVTSDPGADGGYAIGDEIQVGLTFSEAVTVAGAPQLTLDVGGQNRTAAYSEGSTTTQLLFTYTVASGDEDTDGIAVVANSWPSTAAPSARGATNATLTHAGLHSARPQGGRRSPHGDGGRGDQDLRSPRPPVLRHLLLQRAGLRHHHRRDNGHQRRGSRRAGHPRQRHVAQVHSLGRDHPARSGGAGNRDPGGGRWRRCLRERKPPLPAALCPSSPPTR